jgi:hypothetical protein
MSLPAEVKSIDRARNIDETAEVMRRFNDVFLRHDPKALAELVAAECIIENTTPAPNGARCVGRDECVAQWTQIATAAGTHFELEDVVVMGDRAIFAGAFSSVRARPIQCAA